MRYLIAALALAACGGEDFSAGGAEAPDGALTASGGVGGSEPSRPPPGLAGGGSGGSAPSGAGGSPIEPDGGLTHGPDAQLPSASPDAAPPSPSCDPPALGPEDMPAELAWSELFYQKGPECVQCTASPCTRCELGWFPVEQNGTTVTATVNYHQCMPMQIDAGPCEAPYAGCAWWTPGFNISTTIELVADGDGWRAELADYRLTLILGGNLQGLCGDAALIAPMSYIEGLVEDDLIATISALRWECSKT